VTKKKLRASRRVYRRRKRGLVLKLPVNPPLLNPAEHSTGLGPPSPRRLYNEIVELDSRIGRYTLLLSNLNRLCKLVRRRDSIEGAIARAPDDKTWEQLEQRARDKQEEVEVQLQELVKDAIGAEDLARSRTKGMNELMELIPGVRYSHDTREKMKTERFLDRVILAVEGKLQTLKYQRDRKQQRLSELGESSEGGVADPKDRAEKCLAKNKTKPGLCGNPAVYDGRCWIPEHQDQ